MIIKEIRMVLFDIDGVITDGKKYVDGTACEVKTIALKDLDALGLLKEAGYHLGCVTGEDNTFSSYMTHMPGLDFVKTGCKQKDSILKEIAEAYGITAQEICYIGDGKYDIPLLKKVGLSVCPQDALHEVKEIADLVLHTSGGNGCLAELYTRLCQVKSMVQREADQVGKDLQDIISERIREHAEVTEKILEDQDLQHAIGMVSQNIVELFQNSGRLFLCGNGGSAADAQHFAAELVGRFYLERQAFPAEALSTNTSILTSLANDYDYTMVFARQVEAKGREGDILIGITTSGKSENIIRAFQQAKKSKMSTVLMTGRLSEFCPVLEYTDFMISIPSDDTPRIQEGHILIAHIICEIVESKLAGSE